MIKRFFTVKVALLLTFFVAILCCALLCGCELLHNHVYDEWVAVRQSTCSEDGERERYCSCGKKQTAVLGALGHQLIVLEAGISATCTEDGYTQAAICSRCDYKTEKTLIPATGHDIHSYKAKNPTCTEDGWEEYENCTKCNYSTYNLIAALGHNYSDWEVLTRPTCEHDGEKVRICEHDNSHIVSEVLDKRNHIAGDWVTVTEPCCEAEGLKNLPCAECGAVLQTQVIEPLEHSCGEWSIDVEATCETDGLKTVKCTVCETVIQSQTMYSLGHDYGEWQTVLQPTCVTEGKQIKICSHNKAHILEEVLSKLNHTESEEITEQPSCEKDGKKYTQCTVCNVQLSLQILPATNHDYGEWEVVTNASCTQAGIEKRVCKNDGHHFEEQAIPASGHIELLQNDDNNHYKICKTCNEKLFEEPHNIVDGKCTVCNYVEEKLAVELVHNRDGNSYYVSSLADEECTELIIPSTYKGLPVTAIGFEAFRDCKNLTCVNLPDTIEIISENAFYGCESLIKIELSANLNRIEKGAFYNCNKLESITIPANVNYIGSCAFYGCVQIKSIYFKNPIGWDMYEENKLVQQFTENEINEYPKIIIVYLTNNLYIWKRV